MRTFRVQGWGTGTAVLTASLDGNQIWSGSVDLQEFEEANQDYKTAPTLFSFELPVEFGGTKQMKITVDKAMVRFGQIVANFTEVDWGAVYYTGEFEFADVAPIQDEGIRDPRANVRIDGVLQNIDRQASTGTWHWYIMPGQTFEHDLLIAQGSLFE